MLRKLMLALPVGAFLTATTFVTTALYPKRCEAFRMEVDYVFYSDCSFETAIGERDLQCGGHAFTWGDISGSVFVRNYYNCEGKWLSCASTCGYGPDGYRGCVGAVPQGTGSAFGCSPSPSPPAPVPLTPPDEPGKRFDP